MPHDHQSLLTPLSGGVFTDEVGVITGPLELRTSCADDGTVEITVRYAEADEWYHPRGLTALTLHDPADARTLHDALHAVLHRPED